MSKLTKRWTSSTQTKDNVLFCIMIVVSSDHGDDVRDSGEANMHAVLFMSVVKFDKVVHTYFSVTWF